MRPLGAPALETGTKLVPPDTGKGLGSLSLFSDLPPEAVAALEKRCGWRRYAAKEQIVHRADDSRDVYFVVEGQAKVVNYSLVGHEVAYGRVNAGGYFGELAAIDGQPRSASVIAVEDSLVAVLTPQAFIGLLAIYPEVSLKVMRRLAHIIRGTDERIMDLSTLTAVQRVHVELIRLARQDPDAPGAWVIRPMPTQRDIARQASTSRETVARVLSQLAKADIVERGRRWLVIRDRERLAMLAELIETEEEDEDHR